MSQLLLGDTSWAAPDVLPKARLVMSFVSVGLIFGTIFAVIFAVIQRNLPVTIAVVACTFLTILTPLTVRWTQSTQWAGHIFSTVLFIPMCFVSLLKSYVVVDSLMFFTLIPILVGYLSGRRAAIIWTTALVVTCIAFYLRTTYVELPDAWDLDPKMLNFVHIVCLVSLLGLVSKTAITIEGSRLEAELARQRAQEHLERSRRLETLGLLTAGMAHEVNNPLTYVLTNLQSLAEIVPRIEQGVSNLQEILESHGAQETQASTQVISRALAEVVDCTQEALQGSERIRDIVRQLNTHTKGDSEARGRIDLRSAAEAATKIAMNHIRFRARFVEDFDTVDPVQGVESRLYQVFVNLLVNAAHAIDEGHREQNEIRFSIRQEGEEIIAEISDTGRGMSPNVVDRVFDPFFTEHPLGIGTGLGLFISHNIVKSHGGHITAESTPGKGTRFIVSLPRAGDSVPEETSQPQQHQSSERRGRVLVVDDEPSIRRSMKRILGGEVDVVTAGSGAEAQSILENDPLFDAIVSDLIMAEVSGMELFEWLESHQPELAHKVIFYTGGAFTPQSKAFIENISNPCLEKPVPTAELIGHIRSLIDP